MIKKVFFSFNKKEKLQDENDLNFKKKKGYNTRAQIFKTVLSGLLLSIAVATSLFELRIPILGAMVPVRVFDVFIFVLAIPVIGAWYTLAIAIIEPWLHLALDGDHPPIQMVFDDLSNIILVISFILIFYKLFNLNNTINISVKKAYVKRTFAGLILIPLNAIVSSLAFAFTIIVLANSSMARPGDFAGSVAPFYKSGLVIFFILVAVELLRFLVIYILFVLVQRKLGQLNRFTAGYQPVNKKNNEMKSVNN